MTGDQQRRRLNLGEGRGQRWKKLKGSLSLDNRPENTFTQVFVFYLGSEESAYTLSF